VAPQHVLQVQPLRQHGTELARAVNADVGKGHPAVAVHLRQTFAGSVGKTAFAPQRRGVHARQQHRKQMQVLAQAVGQAAEVQHGQVVQVQAGFFLGFAQRRCQRCLAVVDAALGQVPVALAGDVAQQQFALRIHRHHAAAQALGERQGLVVSEHHGIGTEHAARVPCSGRSHPVKSGCNCTQSCARL